MAIVALALLIVAPLIGLSALALTSPYASVVVPPGCAQTADYPSDRSIDIVGHGPGIILAESGDRSVVIGIDLSLSPRPLAAYLVDRPTTRVLWEVAIASDTVVAAFDGGIVFLWDDKIGYAISAASGDPLGALVRSDNYRGIFTVGDSRHLQVDAEVTSFGLGGTVFSHHEFPLAGIVDGCVFGVPSG